MLCRTKCDDMAVIREMKPFIYMFDIDICIA